MEPKSTSTEATRIQERLTATNRTWGDLGNALDVAPQNLYNWRERGVPKHYLAPVAQFIDCSIEWLLTGRDRLEKEPSGQDFLAKVMSEGTLTSGEWALLQSMAQALLSRQQNPHPQVAAPI